MARASSGAAPERLAMIGDDDKVHGALGDELQIGSVGQVGGVR